MKRRILFALASLALLAGCGSDATPKGKGAIDINNSSMSDAGTNNVDPNNVSNPDMGPDTVPDATMSSQDAPTIIELGASPSRISEGQSTLVSAIVTDPQGVEDIVAGRLLDGQTSDLIGNFRSIGGGSFEIDVSWSLLDSFRPISFGPNGTQRSLTAEFIDNANERSTRSLSITLDCEGLSACEGTCGFETCNGACLDPFEDYFSDENCGGCGVSCRADQTCGNQGCEALPESDVGGPCTSEADCDGSLCATEAEFNVPGGYCAYLCSVGADCPGNSECIPFDTGQGDFPLCATTCTSNADCRTDYLCLEYQNAAGVFVDVCSPF